MKVARFQIAWIMLGVAIAALDFAVIRAMLRYPEIGYFVLGALPMANVLVIGSLIARRRPGNRPYHLGFGACGAMALALFLALLSFDQDQNGPIFHYLGLFYAPLEKAVGMDRPYVRIPLECSGVAGMLTLPQAAFAMIGGSLSRRFRITITRR